MKDEIHCCVKYATAHHFCEVEPTDDMLTIINIGKTGTGKSTLASSFIASLYDKVVNDKYDSDDDDCEEDKYIYKYKECDCLPFNISSSINPCTYLTTFKIGYFLGINGNRILRVGDTPGLSEGKKEDQNHISNMIIHIRQKIKQVNQFNFIINGQEPRFDNATKLLLQTFGDAFGP